mgnify:CR=1 FL=1
MVLLQLNKTHLKEEVITKKILEGGRVKKIRVLGTWEKTYIVRNPAEAIGLAKKDMDMYPHLRMEVKTATLDKYLGEEE